MKRVPKPKRYIHDGNQAQYLEARAEEDENYGPAMQACTERQRAAVLAYIRNGDGDWTRAVIDAGYGHADSSMNSMYVSANYVRNSPKVQAALAEEAVRRLNSHSVIAVTVVAEIMMNKENPAKVRLDAAVHVMNRTGLHAKTESLVTVKNETTEAQIQRVKSLAGQLGLDAKQLLNSVGIIDAEFEEVTP